MGTWIIMPLLSTMAALIIIVNSMEEGMESDRYDRRISPRNLNSESTEFDQLWRSINVQPMMEESAPVEDWHELSPQEPPKRRRPGRKRKRRPQPTEQESIRLEKGTEFEERIKDSSQESESQVVYETTELPRRRRKRPEMRNNYWHDEIIDSQKPTRRRGQRRRRPINKDNDEQTDIPDSGMTIQHRPIYNEDGVNYQSQHNIEARHRKRPMESTSVERVLDSDSNIPNKKSKMVFMDTSIFDLQENSKPVLEDPHSSEIINASSQTVNDTSETSNKQVGSLVEPSSLKELLKRSDGTSLSEILQQRNLSLADLLNGKEKAISALQTNYQLQNEQQNIEQKYQQSNEEVIEEIKPNEKLIIWPIEQTTSKIQLDSVAKSILEANKPNIFENDKSIIKDIDPVEIKVEKNDSSIRMNTRRRLPPGLRRRQRIRNSSNTTLSNALSYPRRRGVDKATAQNEPVQTERDLINSSTINPIEEVLTSSSTNTPTTTESNEDDDIFVTTVRNSKYTTILPIDTTTNSVQNNKVVNITYSAKATTKSATITSSRAMPITESPQEILFTEKTESAIPHRQLKISLSDAETRRQVLTNRLKKKRMKQKNITEDAEPEVKDVFGMANLVSASEFIAKIQSPDTTLATTALDDDQTGLTLEDITMPDEDTSNNEIDVRKKVNKFSKLRMSTKPYIPVTEKNAKYEIEEILNDSHSSARLSKILSDRNMTLNELVEHRERGSSNVHLADIFQNSSNEINPPEPFLSKSSIEPISRETYPLRALLEANLHDPSNKVLNPDPNMQFTNIPIAMDFGNNVNENGENLGIVTLFNKYHNKSDVDKINIKTDSEGTPYFTSVSKVSTGNETSREGRDLQDMELYALKELFTNLRREAPNQNSTIVQSPKKEMLPTTTEVTPKIEASNENNIILAVEDLQDFRDFENNIARISNDKLEVDLSQETETTTNSGVLENVPSNAKSVTIATAAIAGITMLLFLLTYMGCKWKNQRNALRRRESFRGERIPTPVFENRKLSKINGSNRSISPMLSNTNIYTMSTLDSRNGKDSPDYMWDSLRKPFQ